MACLADPPNRIMPLLNWSKHAMHTIWSGESQQTDLSTALEQVNHWRKTTTPVISIMRMKIWWEWRTTMFSWVYLRCSKPEWAIEYCTSHFAATPPSHSSPPPPSTSRTFLKVMRQTRKGITPANFSILVCHLIEFKRLMETILASQLCITVYFCFIVALWWEWGVISLTLRQASNSTHTTLGIAFGWCQKMLKL